MGPMLEVVDESYNPSSGAEKFAIENGQTWIHQCSGSYGRVRVFLDLSLDGKLNGFPCEAYRRHIDDLPKWAAIVSNEEFEKALDECAYSVGVYARPHRRRKTNHE